MVFIILFTIGGALVYIRYTPPIYESSAVLQINQEQHEQSTILDVENVYGNTNLSNLIELIRSREFLKRVLKKS